MLRKNRSRIVSEPLSGIGPYLGHGLLATAQNCRKNGGLKMPDVLLGSRWHGMGLWMPPAESWSLNQGSIFVFHAVAFALDKDRFSMMEEAIQESGRERRVVVEELRPVLIGPV